MHYFLVLLRNQRYALRNKCRQISQIAFLLYPGNETLQSRIMGEMCAHYNVTLIFEQL